MIDCYRSAREMVAAFRGREVSARELLTIHLDRIAQVNPQINAVVSLDPDRAMAQATRLDDRIVAGEDVGPLGGLPFAFKDTHATGGWPTTYGSTLRRDHVPERDELIVERIRAAGVVQIAKTNVPEWAAGSHTFNPVFGLTRNPYDLERSAGGSSGGAAAALAGGMVPLADGSDMGGSLRNPASFCNVVGLRPTPGRVPSWPSWNAWQVLAVSGPMARDVSDLALLLSVIAGPSERAPLSLEAPGSDFAEPLRPDALRGARVAVSVDLGGTIAVDADVAAVVRASAEVLERLGAHVSADHPCLDGADEAFRTLRAWDFFHRLGDMLRADPDAFKPALRDNIRLGGDLTGADVAHAYDLLTSLAERVRRFYSSYDLLVLPVSQVPPFPADDEFPTQVDGRPQDSYLDWMRSAYLITMTGCPAMSVPAGFSPQGWPIGIQFVTAPRTERQLLSFGYAFEQETQVAKRRPRLAEATA